MTTPALATADRNETATTTVAVGASSASRDITHLTPAVLEEAESPLALPPVPAALMAEISALQSQHESNPDFGGVEIGRDRTGYTIYWYGPQDAPNAAAAASEYKVDVVSTKYRRQDLQREVERLLTSGEAAADTFVMGHVNRDSSGLVLGTSTAARGTPQVDTSYPVEVKVVGDVVPALSRLFDEAPFSGGARIQRRGTGVSCTSAFATRRVGGVNGMLTAAHCGPTAGLWDTPGGRYVGSVTARSTAADAEFMAGGISYMPAVYFGPYATASRVWVTGAASPVFGNEICYSGSFSGVSCGNLVSDTDVVYSLGGDLTNLTGFLTENFDGQPAAGNGDSGGPALLPILSSDGTTYQLWAGGVISAISTSSWGPTCNGVPATSNPPPNGRWCAPTVFAADIADSVNNLNLQVLVAPPP